MKKKSKWLKWQIGAAGALGLAMFFHEVKASPSFDLAVAEAHAGMGSSYSVASAAGTDEYGMSGLSSRQPQSTQSQSVQPEYSQSQGVQPQYSQSQVQSRQSQMAPQSQSTSRSMTRTARS